MDHITEIAGGAQYAADTIVGSEKALEVVPDVVSIRTEQAVGKCETVAYRQFTGKRGFDRPLKMAVQFDLGDHEKPRSGCSGLCNQLSVEYSARPSIRCKA